MSDENKHNQDSLSFDKPDTEPDRPSAPDDQDERSTTAFRSLNSINRRKKADPTKDTAVFSANDHRLQRLLHNQNDENFSTISLGNKQEVILLIRGMVERIVMEGNTAYKMGRFEIGATGDDEIDLTPYGAKDRGVSRKHAELQIIDAVVHITDLNSTNGTFVNTKRVAPDIPTPLRKGDELILGRLPIQILFR